MLPTPEAVLRAPDFVFVTAGFFFTPRSFPPFARLTLQDEPPLLSARFCHL